MITRARSALRIASLLTTIVAIMAVLMAPGVASAAPTAATDVTTQVIDLTNAERARAHLPALVPNAALTRVAASYAGMLAHGTCFAHTCGPVPFASRFDQAGYTGWSRIGENIAGGYPTPAAVVAAWMSSPGHRANILDARFKEIGVGVATGGPYGIYWVQDFGAR